MPRTWQKVKKTREFKNITGSGKKYSTPAFLLFHLPSPLSSLGLIVSKKVGSAVKRNKVKRILREVFSQINPDQGDFVFIARAEIKNYSYLEILGFLQKLFKKMVPNI